MNQSRPVTPAIIAGVSMSLPDLHPWTPTEVVIRQMQRNRRFKIRQLFREAQRENGEPFHKGADGQVVSLDVRGRNRALLALVHAEHAPPLRADYLGRLVNDVRDTEFLDDDAILDVGAESEVNRFRVRRKAVRRNLNDNGPSAGRVGVRVAFVGLGKHQPAGKIGHELPGVIGRPLADQKRRDQLRLLIQTREQEHVANVEPLVLLVQREPGLLLSDERPNLVALNVGEFQAAQLGVKEGAATVAGVNENARHGLFVAVRDSGRGADAIPLDEQRQDLDLIFFGQDVGHLPGSLSLGPVNRRGHK